MMCKGHVLSATITKDGNESGFSIIVTDAEGVGEGNEPTEGNVLSVDMDDDNFISFEIDQARAFIEACQEILDRYDK